MANHIQITRDAQYFGDGGTARIVKNSGELQFGVVGSGTSAVPVNLYRFSDSNYSTVVNSAVLLDTSGGCTWYGQIHGTATSALWADLAEKYKSDKKYEPGTLVCFGGEAEITIATDHADAVVSSKPGFILNDGEEGLPIALVGKVPVKVWGPVHKFDRLYLHPVLPGVAIADNENTDKGNVIGRALETDTREKVKTVMSVIRMKF